MGAGSRLNELGIAAEQLALASRAVEAALPARFLAPGTRLGEAIDDLEAALEESETEALPGTLVGLAHEAEAAGALIIAGRAHELAATANEGVDPRVEAELAVRAYVLAGAEQDADAVVVRAGTRIRGIDAPPFFALLAGIIHAPTSPGMARRLLVRWTGGDSPVRSLDRAKLEVTVGECSLRAGKPELARVHLMAAAQAAPTGPTAVQTYDRLAQTAMRLGRHEEARSWASRAEMTGEFDLATSWIRPAIAHMLDDVPVDRALARAFGGVFTHGCVTAFAHALSMLTGDATPDGAEAVGLFGLAGADAVAERWVGRFGLEADAWDSLRHSRLG